MTESLSQLYVVSSDIIVDDWNNFYLYNHIIKQISICGDSFLNIQTLKERVRNKTSFMKLNIYSDHFNSFYI